MLRITAMSVVLAAATALVAAPEPMVPDAKALVARLSDPSEKVRDEASAALKNRADALPWLRRAARSNDRDTFRRGAELLLPFEKKRQEAVAKAIDACIRDGNIDLVMEWHHYWKPAAEDDLWPIGPRCAKAGVELLAQSCPKKEWERFEKKVKLTESLKVNVHNGPCPQLLSGVKGTWLIRTDQLHSRALNTDPVRFASIDGPASLWMRGLYLVLGPVEMESINSSFVATDGGIDPACKVAPSVSFIVCRGNCKVREIYASVLLVDGDIDLTDADEYETIRHSLIRATGEIRLAKGNKPINSIIQAKVKDATAPYKFFELTDVGLSVVADKEGVIVTDAKADTPIGNCGLAKGDRIRAIDDVRFESPDDFRKKLRRAMVRQGDCLLTVIRDGKTIDLPVFFPMPK